MTMVPNPLAVLIDATWFSIVLLGSQVALVLSVIVLLLIWLVEWRGGRLW